MLGFGRALESFLASVGITWSSVLIFGEGRYQSIILYDINEVLLGAPLLVFSIAAVAGVICNMLGYWPGKMFRVAGTIGCMLIWNWVAWKAVLINAQDLVAFAFAICTLPAYFWILLTALLDLPKPGEAVDGGIIYK